MNLRPVSYCAGFLMCLSACEHPLPCEEDNRRTYHPIELRLIVTDKGAIGTPCDLEGINEVTHQKAEFHSMGAFYIALKDAIALGDTVVKNKGASAFLVKKRGYDIRVNAPCDEIGPTDAYGYAPITTDTIPKNASNTLTQ
jgi:hypothetical protein